MGFLGPLPFFGVSLGAKCIKRQLFLAVPSLFACVGLCSELFAPQTCFFLCVLLCFTVFCSLSLCLTWHFGGIEPFSFGLLAASQEADSKPGSIVNLMSETMQKARNWGSCCVAGAEIQDG